MVMEELRKVVAGAAHELYDIDVEIELSRPDEKFGDFTTNVAMQLAARVGQKPRIIAEQLASKISAPIISKTEVAGPGFLNFRLSDKALLDSLNSPTKLGQAFAGKVVVAEYSDPNPFKVLHAGHLYTSVVGDAIANLFQAAGATVHRVNFGGDVGMHVAKTMYVIISRLGGEDAKKLDGIEVAKRSEWLAECYVEGTKLYEDDQGAKEKIVVLNKRIYELHSGGDKESSLARIYWTCRQWSYDYFDQFYARIGTHFEKYYPESQVAPIGLSTVEEQLSKGVFQKSNGAVIFDGEPHSLHVRVFINSEGLPTYEAKDVGLIITKWNDYRFDKSVVVTGNEQEQYMAVVLKAVEQFQPDLAKNTTHVTHGILKMAGGVKMSSRKGNILRAVEVLDAANAANKKLTGQDNDQTVLGAVRYALLKNRTGGDIIYDPDESVSLQGNSGPYLQYAHARARSILAKQKPGKSLIENLESDERSLLRKISEYPEIVERATVELMPHHICTYLYELAQEFNRFYERNRVIGDKREADRLQLVSGYADVLKSGLELLNIPAPDKM